jgi:transposase
MAMDGKMKRKIAGAYRAGASKEWIAGVFHVSKATVTEALKQDEYLPHAPSIDTRKISEEEKEKLQKNIIDLYRQGFTSYAIGNRLSVSEYIVRRTILRYKAEQGDKAAISKLNTDGVVVGTAHVMEVDEYRCGSCGHLTTLAPCLACLLHSLYPPKDFNCNSVESGLQFALKPEHEKRRLEVLAAREQDKLPSELDADS